MPSQSFSLYPAPQPIHYPDTFVEVSANSSVLKAPVTHEQGGYSEQFVFNDGFLKELGILDESHDLQTGKIKLQLRIMLKNI